MKFLAKFEKSAKETYNLLIGVMIITVHILKWFTEGWEDVRDDPYPRPPFPFKKKYEDVQYITRTVWDHCLRIQAIEEI